MDQVPIELVGGPADGKREQLPTDPTRVPVAWLAVPHTPWRSALDAAVVDRAEMHRYERWILRPDGVWGYEHRGTFG